MKIKKMVCIALTAATLLSTVSAFAMSTYSFDSGMRKGINYFNQGLYYEARDEFQWFADYNWGSLNSSQQKYLLDYLDGAKAKIKEVEYANNHLTQEQFDDGMRAGINYFNKGMFYEACDEFQWFCDYNWGKMNAGQRQYALNYLDGAKAKFPEYVTVYALGDGYVKTEWIHKSRVKEYERAGWSLTKPKAQYNTTDTILTNKAVAYFKNWLYLPNSATIYQTRVYNMEDDWDRENGYVPCKVYIDASVLNTYGYYIRKTFYVSIEFNRYNGNYEIYGVYE